MNDEASSNFPILLIFGLVLTTMLFWGFAFWHAPSGTPDWLLRAQAACFGRTASGLPDSAGWIMLTLAPALMFVTLFVAFGTQLRNGFHALRLTRLFPGLTILLCAVILVEGLWVGTRIANGLRIENTEFSPEETEPLSPTYPQSTVNLSALTPLVDQHGKHFTPSEERRLTILTFAFSHCRTVCPVVVRSAEQAFRELKRQDVRLMIVTLDPWRDTPGSLPTLAKQWTLGEGAHVMSGDIEAVKRVHEAFQLPLSRDERTGDIVHPAIVYVIGSDERSAYVFNNPSVAWIKEAVARLERS